MPDDTEFMQTVQELDTPEKICRYMEDNFIYKLNPFYTKEPYQLWYLKQGDCSDFAKFGMFVANYHGYETYLANIDYKYKLFSHDIAIYNVNGKYNFSSNTVYFAAQTNTLRECVRMYFYYYPQNGLKKYEIYDYNSNYIMGGN